MRFASRVIGGVLVLCGLGFLALLGFVSATEGLNSGFGAWAILGTGAVLILVGWYYFQLDLDKLDQAQPASSFTHFSVRHRVQLTVLAQAGAVMSLVHFGTVCFGTDWPGRWFLWPIGIGALILLSVARKIADPEATPNLGWSRVPALIRKVVEPTRKVGDAAMLVVLALILWNQWSGEHLAHSAIYQRSLRIAASGYFALLYVLEALFFRYGELRLQREAASSASPLHERREPIR